MPRERNTTKAQLNPRDENRRFTTMAQLNPLEENRKFTLTYNNSIEEPRDLFRRGGVKRPITVLRCHELSRSCQYEHTPPRIDFLIDSDGYVIPDKSSGFSFFSSIPAMVQVLSDTHGKVWKLSRGSPFPDELQIDYQGGKHGNIKPKSGSRLTKEQLEEMLKCLPWERH